MQLNHGLIVSRGRSATTSPHSHLVIVRLRLLGVGRVAAVLGGAASFVDNAAQRAEVVQMHRAVVRARQQELVLHV